jgi:CO/xanthine dehydrogenase Mo-binding subunit
MTYAGTRMARVEDTRLLTGHGTFVDDIVRPGMLHACFVRSPFARARINGIDLSGQSLCQVWLRCSPPPISTRTSGRPGTR